MYQSNPKPRAEGDEEEDASLLHDPRYVQGIVGVAGDKAETMNKQKIHWGALPPILDKEDHALVEKCLVADLKASDGLVRFICACWDWIGARRVSNVGCVCVW